MIPQSIGSYNTSSISYSTTSYSKTSVHHIRIFLTTLYKHIICNLKHYMSLILFRTSTNHLNLASFLVVPDIIFCHPFHTRNITLHAKVSLFANKYNVLQYYKNACSNMLLSKIGKKNHPTVKDWEKMSIKYKLAFRIICKENNFISFYIYFFHYFLVTLTLHFTAS